MRVPQSAVMIATYKAFGAIPSLVPWTSTFQALQSGEVDGQCYGYIGFRAMKFNEANQKYLTEVHYTYHLQPLVISTRVFDKFSPDTQKILIDAGKHAQEEVLKFQIEQAGAAKRELIASGLQVFQSIPPAGGGPHYRDPEQVPGLFRGRRAQRVAVFAPRRTMPSPLPRCLPRARRAAPLVPVFFQSRPSPRNSSATRKRNQRNPAFYRKQRRAAQDRLLLPGHAITPPYSPAAHSSTLHLRQEKNSQGTLAPLPSPACSNSASPFRSGKAAARHVVHPAKSASLLPAFLTHHR